MNWKEQIVSQSEAIYQEMIEWRNHLHANPELSFEEYETSKYVHDCLRSFGISDIHQVAGTGICGSIGTGEKTIALRADLDALPIEELNDVAYKSKKKGLMHACGHDVHTTCLLGALKILKQYENELPHRVMFVFQPGEEKLPGGASLIINSGIFEKYQPEFIVGQHVYPEMEVGKIGVKEGIYMASCDELFITVKGKGGHGARPNHNIDPILVGSHIVVSLQQIVSRMADPKIPTVVSIGEFIAQGATNICPDKTTMQGTIRTFNEEQRSNIHKQVKQLCESIGNAMGAEVEVFIDKGYPFLRNDETLVKDFIPVAQDLVGVNGLEQLDIRMTAEDFSYYSQHMRSLFYRLGVRNESKGITASVHSPHFDIDENALKIGAQLLALSAVRL